MNRIFLDNAATTPIDPEVVAAMTEVMQQNFGNPSSIHQEGRTARAAIEQARKKVANLIGASIGEIFFTSGGTESNNMALKGAVRDQGVKRIISAKTEHHCVLHSLDRLMSDNEVEVVYLDLDKKGRIDLNQLDQVLGGQSVKTLVSLMHSNNEIGTMIDLEAVSEICKNHAALFHTDTVQTMGYFPIDVSKLHISFLSGSGHKFYGPKGCGFVYINGDNIIKPYIDGGSQERNMRGGTENIYGIVGLAKAFELAIENLDTRRQKIEGLRNYFKEKLQSEFEGIQLNGDVDGLSHFKVLSVSFPPTAKSDLLLLSLDIAGISASGGSACSSGVDVGSHVLAALDCPPDWTTIRFSFSHHNTKEEIDYLLTQLKEIIPEKVIA